MPVRKFPHWIRREWPSGGPAEEVKALLGGLRLHTVCQSAHCPNQAECWGRRTATLMVLGNICTRHCAFCAVNSGRPAPPDPEEPDHVAEAVARLGLAHVVITSVTRDDLVDGGADHFARTVEAVKARTPGTTVEVLTPDFRAEPGPIQHVLDSGAEVFSHNIETVKRLHPRLRDRRFTYGLSLKALGVAAARAAAGQYIKSAFMLGCGETAEDIRATLADLLETGVTVVSMGQYLRPSAKHHPVERYVTPEEFQSYEQMAYDMGFAFAVAGPFVRSSYRSEELFRRGAAAPGANDGNERTG